LGDGEDALAAEFLALFRAHPGQQTEIVLFHGFLSAVGLELAFGAVPVQDEIGWGRAGEKCRDFLNALPHLAGQG
jgi:hypothetical protein